jgi:hypothetical protein
MMRFNQTETREEIGQRSVYCLFIPVLSDFSRNSTLPGYWAINISHLFRLNLTRPIRFFERPAE